MSTYQLAVLILHETQILLLQFVFYMSVLFCVQEAALDGPSFVQT